MGEVQHIFLVGAKSLGAYGGYETFINKLTEEQQWAKLALVKEIAEEVWK